MSWTLVLQSFSVLRKDKKLVLFPVLSALGVIAVAIPYLWALTGGTPWRPADVHWGVSGWLWIFLWYCTSSFVVVFFNCAMTACAQVRFSGGEPSISDGIHAAGDRIGRILLWSVTAATVGLIIRMIEERANLIGKIVASLIGIAWGLATFLVIPVLVFEDLDVIESIRRSGELLKKTWGEQLVVGFHFFWITLVLFIPGVILGALALPVGIAYFLALAAVMTAARSIFVVALYRFAVTGEPPDGYSHEALSGAFRRR